MIGAFGEKTFEVSSNRIYTIDGVSLSGELSTQTQKVSGKKPSTQIEGPGLSELNFSMSLKAAFGVNVREEISQWEALRDAGVPKPFNIGGRPLSENKWLVKRAQATDFILTSGGKMLSANLKLTFEEYVRPGSAPQKSENTLAFDVENVKNWEASQEEKAELKRTNPNVTAAINEGKLRKADRLML